MVQIRRRYNSSAGGSYRNTNYGTRRNTRSYGARTTEVKAVDYYINDTTFTNTGTVYLLNGCVQGTASYQRIGLSINPTSIRVRGSVAPQSASSFPGPFIRCAIVYDSSPKAGVLASYTDIFQGYSANGDTVNSGSVSPNPSNVNRFTIIRDIQMQLGYISNANNVVYSTSPAQFTVDEFINTYNRQKKQPFQVQYKNASNTGTQIDISTGAFLMVIYNSLAQGTMNANFSIRFSYTDA